MLPNSPRLLDLVLSPDSQTSFIPSRRKQHTIIRLHDSQQDQDPLYEQQQIISTTIYIYPYLTHTLYSHQTHSRPASHNTNKLSIFARRREGNQTKPTTYPRHLISPSPNNHHQQSQTALVAATTQISSHVSQAVRLILPPTNHGAFRPRA